MLIGKFGSEWKKHFGFGQAAGKGWRQKKQYWNDFIASVSVKLFLLKCLKMEIYYEVQIFSIVDKLL